MFIQTEACESPDSMVFLPGRAVMPAGTLVVGNRAPVLRSPLAARIIAVPGVESVVLGADSITVTREEGDWAMLKPALLGAIMEHYLSGDPVLAGEAETGAAAATTAAIRLALHQVIDPELGHNLVDIGLIYDIAVDAAGAATVTMTTTTAGCPATDYLTSGVRAATAAVAGVTAVDVVLTYAPQWTPEMMSAAAKQTLGVGGGRRR